MPEQTNPLADLNDIILPTEFETALPALGWWLLAGFMIVLLLLALFIAWRYWRLNQPRREAMAQLKQAELSFAELNLLLKRLALSYYPRQQVASLSGEAWLAFLDSKVKVPSGSFLELSAQWQHCLYAATPSSDSLACRDMAEQWIKRCRAPLSLATLFSLKGRNASDNSARGEQHV